MPVLLLPVIVSSLLSCNGADKVQSVDEEITEDTTDEIDIKTFG